MLIQPILGNWECIQDSLISNFLSWGHNNSRTQVYINMWTHMVAVFFTALQRQGNYWLWKFWRSISWVVWQTEWITNSVVSFFYSSKDFFFQWTKTKFYLTTYQSYTNIFITCKWTSSLKGFIVPYQLFIQFPFSISIRTISSCAIKAFSFFYSCWLPWQSKQCLWVSLNHLNRRTKNQFSLSTFLFLQEENVNSVLA